MAKSYKTLYSALEKFRETLPPLEDNIKLLKQGGLIAVNPLSSELRAFHSPREIYDWLMLETARKEAARQIKQIDIAIKKVDTASRLIHLQKLIAGKMKYAMFDLCLKEDKSALQTLFTQTWQLGEMIRTHNPPVTAAIEKFGKDFSAASTEMPKEYMGKSENWIFKKIRETRMAFVEAAFEGLQVKADKTAQLVQQASLVREAMLTGIVTGDAASAANDEWPEQEIGDRVLQSDRMIKELYMAAVTLKGFLAAFNSEASRQAAKNLGEPNGYISASILPFAQKPA